MAFNPGGTSTQPGGPAQPSQPAFFNTLLERGKKRQSAAISDAGPVDIPNLQLGIGGLRSLAQGISRVDRDDPQTRGVGKKGLSSLAASGIPPSAVRSKLASLDTQAASSGTPRHSESFDPDTQRFLRQIQQRGKDAIATDSFNRVRNEFNTFLEDKIALSWEDQREKMFESLGLGHYKNNRPVNDMSKTGDYTAASALRSRSSVFGRSGLKKSVIGTPTSGPMGTHIFGDAAAAQSDPYPSNSRALREKMERYAAIVRNLNSARMQEKPYPILHELREIEHNPTDGLHDAYDAIVKIVGESKLHMYLSSDRPEFAQDYLNDNPGSDAAVRMRERIIAGSRGFLEERFRNDMNDLLNSDPKTALRGGIPSPLSKVRAYIRLRFQRKDLAADDAEFQQLGEDHCWVLIFYLLRGGFVKEAAEYVSQNNFRSMDPKFAMYMTTYALEGRLPRDLQQKAHIEYQQRVRNAPDIDPYRMACYKIVGRCEPSNRRFEGINQKIEDWTWLQFVFAREESRVEEIAGDSFGLLDLRKDFLDIGQRVFADNSGNHAIYFLLQILAGMFEHAVVYLGQFEPASAVHLAIGLNYYGLLRVSNYFTSNELLSYTTSDQPQINFASIILQYTRDFRAGDPEAAVDYFSLLCLNTDILGDLGKSQVSVCHEALREFILESREFTNLLGDIKPDGTRIKGAIEQRSKLFGIHDDKEFFRLITLQAAAIASDKGLVADAARLYHLAEDYDKVTELINQGLSDTIVSNAAIPDSNEGRTTSSTEGPGAESISLAYRMRDLYGGNAMYYSKISRENLSSFELLLRAIEAKKFMDKSLWSEALDEMNGLAILPLTAEGSVSYIRNTVQTFSTLPPVVSRIVGQLMMWCIQCIGKRRESLQQGLYENDMRHALYDQLLTAARDLMTFAGMVRYKLSPKLYQALACAAGDIGL